MCGIAGYYSNKIKLKKKNLINLKKLMSVRGPDGFGKYQIKFKNNDRINFFHSRLKIIDPSSRSNQPMIDENGLLIFNGMIYNYLEIKKDLLSKKINFKTNSDTEVLLKFLNYYGPKKLEKLDGMWAFAYFNFKNNSLIISRDKFGEKPLYYSLKNNELIFGSNLNYISTISNSNYKINYHKLESIIKNSFRTLFLNNETLFKGISSLESGTYLEFDSKKNIRIKKYWLPEKVKTKKNKSYKKIITDLKKEFFKSIKRRFISDFQISCALSGGIDSGSIVSIANRKMKKKIHSFSIKPKNLNYSENENILKVVKQNRLNHTFVNIQKNNSKNLKNLNDIIKKTSSILPTTTWLIFNELCKKIKKSKCKVVLSGSGGDEIFAGYYIHHLIFLYSLKNDISFNKKFDEWKKYVVPYIRSNKLKNFDYFKKLKNFNERKFYEYLDNNSYVKGKLRRKNILDKGINLSDFKKSLFTDIFKFTLPFQLYSMDNVAMYNGLESRVPLLSGDIYKYILTIPTKYFIQNGYSKKILRDLVKGFLPSKLLKDRNKIGFFMNIDDIYDFKDKKIINLIINNKFIKKNTYLEKIKEIMKKDDKTNQESHLLFTLLNISLFIKNYEMKN